MFRNAIVKVIVVVFFAVGPTISYSADIRGIQWGSTIGECKSKEKARFISEEKRKNGGYFLYYETEIGRDKYKLSYNFSGGELEGVSYVITLPKEGKVCSQVIGTFIQSVTAKHGKPVFSMVSPDGFEEKRSSCEGMIKLKYNRMTNWEGYNNGLMFISTSDDGIQFSYVVTPNLSADIMDNI